jgi:hypothetical protein|tara:strand:+ start:285 stop:653 length:369 start_codon:yes stop_codon:yes gene_type:complete
LKTKRRKQGSPEHSLQKSLVDYMLLSYPKILFCASAGGMRTSMSQAIKMKSSGYVKGFPDMFVYEPKNKFNGLAIELKVKGNYPSPHQVKWISDLNARGYKAVVCTGFQEAINELNNYMRND